MDETYVENCGADHPSEEEPLDAGEITEVVNLEDESDEPQLLIQYRHDDCKVDPGVEWTDTWSSAVDGECPACGMRNIVPVSWENA
jgi:hypothetical protein